MPRKKKGQNKKEGRKVTAEGWDDKSAVILKEKINAWKKESHKTNDAFASEIGITRSQLQKIFNGRSYPSIDVFDQIVRVLKCRPDEFFSQSDEWSYKYSPEYQRGIIGKLDNFAYHIGLDTVFLEFVKECTDFDSDFPVYSNLVRNPNLFAEMPIYRNPNFLTAAHTHNTEDSIYQMNHNGKNITLSFADILYLKDLQDSVIRHIEKHFKKRSAEMENEVIEACKSIKIPIKAKEGEQAFAYKPFTEEKYLKIDKYARKIKEYLEGSENNGKCNKKR